MSTSIYALGQISLRVPDGFLAAADRVVAHQSQVLIKEGRGYEADRITRSVVLRQALEKGILVLANDLPCPKSEIFLPPEKSAKVEPVKAAKSKGARAKKAK